MKRLPLTVIGGYLGAGKTTLINHLLQSDHGKRLMVMVNDFGAVNIDAELLASATDDTLELTNGCVCCTMGADLFMAVGDVLDRPERPDHLIIEASGIADPARIAEVSRTEPELSYAGIVTVVDGDNFADLIKDTQIAPQLIAQVDVADLIYLSKSAHLPEGIAHNASPVLRAPSELVALIWDLDGEAPTAGHAHAHFIKWAHQGTESYTRAELQAKLAHRPDGVYRLKGFVQPGWEVQVVGKSVEITQRDDVTSTVLVGIGPEGRVSEDQMKEWWQG